MPESLSFGEIVKFTNHPGAKRDRQAAKGCYDCFFRSSSELLADGCGFPNGGGQKNPTTHKNPSAGRRLPSS